MSVMNLEVASNSLLDIKKLEVRFYSDRGVESNAVNGASIKVEENSSIGIVGESGCGKSVSMFSVLGLLPPNGKVTSGEILYKLDDTRIDLAKIKSNGRVMRKIRGKQIAMIFQEPMTAFGPVHTIGNQICEAILLHSEVSKKEATDQAIDLLDRVGIANAKERIQDYPFQLSGGMLQRAMIAMALSCNPKVLIADEPTTALDVTIQAQVLEVIRDLREEFKSSLILITHDLGVVAHMVEYVYVMYLGEILEQGPVKELFKNPAHPYTKGLLNSMPRLSGSKGRLATIKGSVPSGVIRATGCSFAERCEMVLGQKCFKEIPESRAVGREHWAKCFRV